MGDRTAASVGFGIAGLALAAALVGWPRVDLAAVGLAGLALVAFGARRYGHLDREVGAGLAGGVSIALAVVAAYGAATSSTGAVGLGMAAIGGGLAAVMAYADWLGIPRDRLTRRAGATATATAIGIAGLVAIFVWGQVIILAVRGVVRGPIDASLVIPLSTVALGLGTGTVAALYLGGTARGLSFVDLKRPGRGDAAYVVAGVIAIVALNVGIGVAFQRLGVESAQHAIIREAQSDPGILLVLVPLSYLIIGPGEELLYRNIVQKSLYGAFSRPGAVVVASAIFAGVHLFAFADPNGGPLATVNTLIVVFVLSIVLGVVYERTENVLVPALVHGSFDAIAFAVTYAQLSGL